MPDQPALRNCVLAVIQALRMRTSRLTDAVTQGSGFTPLQACILLLLAGGAPEITIGDIVQQTGIGQANASVLCKKLETDGYLTRTRSEKDRRVVLLALTESGQEAAARYQETMDRMFAYLEDIPKETLDTLAKGIQAAETVLDYLYEKSPIVAIHQEES